MMLLTVSIMLPPRGRYTFHPRKGGIEGKKTEVPKISSMYYS